MSQRIYSASLIVGVAFGVTFFATWAVWKYLKKKHKRYEQSSYVAGKDIRVVNSSEEWEAAYLQLHEYLTTHKVLGLDCEWVQKHKVALLQLATPSGLCVLVRLFKLNQPFPKTLRRLLEDKSILKVGVAVVDDGRKLHQDYGLTVCGCIDLRHILKRIRGVFHCSSRGLRGLANGVLGVDISKSFGIRCGNWEADRFSTQQIDYAATDAAVAVDIFFCIVYAKLLINNPHLYQNSQGNRNGIKQSEIIETQLFASAEQEKKSVPAVTSEHKPSKLLNSIGDSKKAEESDNDDDDNAFESDREDHNMTSKKQEAQKAQIWTSNLSESTSSCPQSESAIVLKESLNSVKNVKDLPHELNELFWKTAHSMCQGIVDAGYSYQERGKQQPTSKSLDKQKKITYSTRKRPLWDNCRLEAPDGNVLCTCDTRKAQWYLDKELGDKVCDDPLTVRLRFEPAMRPQSERNYFLQDKENVCVVCGYDVDYVRKFVIPFEYRKFFPTALKDHSSHDVLLLCTACHRRSCDYDSALRVQLAEECDAPVESGSSAKTVLDHELQKIRSAGRALKLNRQSIPENRVVELEKVLKDFYGVNNVTYELMEQASAVDARHTAEDFVPHGKRVVRHMARNGGLLAFQARWRQHFLDTMNPQFLPTFWSVDFVPEGWNQQQ